MDAYDPALAPAAFGLQNTGAICYLNSFLQALAGCTALTRAVLQNEDYLRRTRTGAAVHAYVSAYAAPPEAGAPTAPLSAAVLQALVADLAERRPSAHFGAGQESASEALVHLLDMMEPPRLPAAEEAAAYAAPVEPPPGGSPGAHVGPAVHSAESPVTRLFLHRFRCDLHCRDCKKVISKETDYAVTFNLFHLDHMQAPPATVDAFTQAVRVQVSATDGYRCPNCAARTSAFRVYNLTMVPELVACTFNLYVGYGGARRARYFPARLEFPATDGGRLVFCLVGQVEHAGSLAGGHYWARALRAEGRVFLLNDTGVSPSGFAPTANTYMVFYHYTGHEPPQQKGG